MRMEQNAYKNYYFIGVGGIGMSSLARYYNGKGCNIAGYDRTRTPLTDQLETEGIKVHYRDDIEMIPQEFKKEDSPGDTMVVYTPAVPASHDELSYFINAGYKVLKRAQLLGAIADNEYSIAVAGTHGKTTVSSMIAHIMKYSEVSSTAFIGGISTDYDSNLIQSGDGSLIIAEADEYDRSFLALKPNIAVVTAIDEDHLDVYGDHNSLAKSYSEFVKGIKHNGILFVKKGLSQHLNANVPVLEYAIEEKADYYADNISINEGQYRYDLHTPKGPVKDIALGLPGRHNIENSVGAFAVADQCNIDHDKIKEALQTYKGVKRRFETIYKSSECVYIDDYAHHPKELLACISSVKEMYGGKKITGVFQPHLYSRTRDFSQAFAESLSLLDELILLEIYPAREKPIPGVDSQLIFDKVNLVDKRICSKEELLKNLNPGKLEVLLTLGAGDIDQLVIPIKKRLEKRENSD